MSEFPAGLLEWSGHRSGGVRKPFYDLSGRPCRDVIRTPLLERTKEWAVKLVAGEVGTARALFLVGGPGNGKTETVEQLLVQFDHALGLGGQLLRRFETEFKGDQSTASPRLVQVEVGDVTSPGKISRIVVVQDASMTDSERPGVSPPQLLVEDVVAQLAECHDAVYVACVNRGILDDALIEASVTRQSKAHKFLETVVSSIELRANPVPCWPLDGYPSVAVWPMDMESLLHDPSGSLLASPAGQVLEKSLVAEKWPRERECTAGNRCPFCGSAELLRRDERRAAFLQVLRWNELATGKRWSFRDLFSLYSYLLAGTAREHAGKVTDPCRWAADVYQDSLASVASPSPARLRAPFILASALYHHAAFNRWQRPARLALRKDIQELGLQQDAGIMGLYHFLTGARDNSVPPTLSKQLEVINETLDPALADPSDKITLSTREVDLGRDIDARFSQSVREGLEQCRRQLHPLEFDVLERLALTDERLSDSAVRQSRPAAAKRLQNLVRDFSCRLVRRSLGVGHAVVKDRTALQEYQQIVEGSAEPIHRAVRKVEGLLNHRDRFIVTLNSTFGQPTLSPSRRAVLSSGKQRVRAMDYDATGRPSSVLPFLRIGNARDGQTLPLTFELFRAVRDLELGLLPASLPRPVVALLDTSRAKLAGYLVRDEDSLEDSEIQLGTTGTTVRRELNQFVVTRPGRK
jgi:hypothetical protein